VPLVVRGYEEMAAARSIGPKQRERALAHVVRLYESWNKPEQAEAWRLKQQSSAAGPDQPGR
jgi:hypothetical protein